MNEAEFVDYLVSAFPFSHGFGIGDDASVVKKEKTGLYQLITKDILVESVHFRLEDFSLPQLAWKSLAVNLSDIAAMGGVPRYFYLGLAFPGQLPREAIFDFFKGIESACRHWNVQLAGGDFSASPLMMISITVVGDAPIPVYRHNAQTNDLVGITRPTGESAAGLKLILNGIKEQDILVEKHKNVEPELEKGVLLAPYVHAMIDISDGLLMDFNRVLAASKKGGVVFYENLPVSDHLRSTCKEHGWNEREIVLAGGEDYVLLFTISPGNEKKLKRNHPGLEYYIIGVVNDDPGLKIQEHGETIDIPHSGYDHFSARHF